MPDRYTHLDTRGRIRTSLRTSSLEVARRKRDDLVEADNAYWAGLEQEAYASSQCIAMNLYVAAKKRAMARGYIYTPTSELSETAGLNEIIARLADALKPASPGAQKQEVEALLGGPKPVATVISEAFEIYCRDLEIGDLKGKSRVQQKAWRKVKYRAVNNFIKLCGDLPMDKITRKEGRDFYMC